MTGEFDVTSYENGKRDAALSMSQWLNRRAEWMYHIFEENGDCECHLDWEFGDDFCEKWNDPEVQKEAVINFWGMTPEEYEVQLRKERHAREIREVQGELHRAKLKVELLTERCKAQGIDPKLLP